MTTIPVWADLLDNIVLSVAAAVLFAFIYFANPDETQSNTSSWRYWAILLSGGIRSIELGRMDPSSSQLFVIMSASGLLMLRSRRDSSKPGTKANTEERK